MQKKDYYSVLGVSRTESSQGIKAAFWKLAKEHHPDRAGAEHTYRFQEITEAYETLSNPEARAEYNRTLPAHSHAGRPKPSRTASRSLKQKIVARSEVEPGRQGGPFEGIGVDPFFNGLLNDLFSGIAYPKAVPAWEVEVLLSPDEAEEGGYLPIPVSYRCPACEGSGRGPLFNCTECFGRGRIETGRSIRIAIPNGIADGTIIEAPAAREPTRTSPLRILIRVR